MAEGATLIVTVGSGGGAVTVTPIAADVDGS
jgi:hypothetical protein